MSSSWTSLINSILGNNEDPLEQGDRVQIMLEDGRVPVSGIYLGEDENNIVLKAVEGKEYEEAYEAYASTSDGYVPNIVLYKKDNITTFVKMKKHAKKEA